MSKPDATILTGLTEQHLVRYQDAFSLHIAAAKPFALLCQAAAQRGFDIRIVSSFRSYQRQAAIWHGKISGARTVFDQAGTAVDITKLHGSTKLDAVLLYSALPGASRHHWGTDIDIYDAASVPQGYQPQLTPAEYGPDGPFYNLQQWLTNHAAEFDFFQPYQTYQGGVAAEPWHISYMPVAEDYLAHFTADILHQCLLQHPLAEQQLVLQYLDTIFDRYVCNVCRPDK